jgi:hypothetical protein
VAVISTLTRTHSATLVDVSQTGVRLSGDDLPEEGEELFLGIEQIRTFGCVAWKRDGECGLAFDEPLPAAELQELRRKAGNGRGLSLEMRTALEDWNLGLAR